MLGAEKQVYKLVADQLPRDRALHEILREAYSSCALSDTPLSEIHECSSFILALLEGQCNVAKYDTKHYNSVALICAAWLKMINTVEYMLLNSKDNRAHLTHYVALVYAYQGAVKTVKEFLDFMLPVKPNYEYLSNIAYYAGAGGNKDLVYSLWKHEPFLLKYCLHGAQDYQNEESMQQCEEIGTSLDHYHDKYFDEQEKILVLQKAINYEGLGAFILLYIFGYLLSFLQG